MFEETCDKCGEIFTFDPDTCFMGDPSGGRRCSIDTVIISLCAECNAKREGRE